MKLGVFTGLAGLDIVYYQNNIPLENKKSKTNNYNVLAGGPAANAAITYAMLGGKSLLVTCIGNSEMGRVIKKDLKDYGVDIVDCAGDAEVLPSISSISINMSNASRTIWSGQQLFKISSEINIGEILKEALFCFCDCNLPEVSTKVLQEAKKASKPIILDAGSWKENFDFYLSVADDAIASADCKPPTHNEDFIAAARSYGVENIAVTNGQGLIKWKSLEEEGAIKPPEVEAVDTLGAGDVFHGAYCYFKVIKELSFHDSLQRAAEVASLSVQRFGPREGVRKFLDKERL